MLGTPVKRIGGVGLGIGSGIGVGNSVGKIGIGKDAPTRRFRYAPMDKRFREREWANVLVPDFSGPLNPGATFDLYGWVRVLSDTQFADIKSSFAALGPDTDGTSKQYLELAVNATVALTNHPEAPDIYFHVNAVLRKPGEVICERAVRKHLRGTKYIHNKSTIVVGEAYFPLPEPTDVTPLVLYLTGSYHAAFPEVQMPISYSTLKPAQIEMSFLIVVEEE